MKCVFNGCGIVLEQGDITQSKTDGIVNAANSSLMGGGGVDGAIHRAGGSAILDECKVIREEIGALPPGDAVVTTAGRLSAKKVIHTVGPIWRGGGESEAEILDRCYQNSLTAAKEQRLRRVAFPSISTGVYGYPIDQAADVAVEAVKRFLETNAETFDEICWVLFDSRTFESYERALKGIC